MLRTKQTPRGDLARIMPMLAGTTKKYYGHLYSSLFAR